MSAYNYIMNENILYSLKLEVISLITVTNMRIQRSDIYDKNIQIEREKTRSTLLINNNM